MTADTLIGATIDRSGSMGSVVPDTISGFNAWLKEQQEAPGKARLSLVLFDTTFQTPFVAEKIKDVPDLGDARNPYTIGGCTALFDAVGTMIRGLEAWCVNNPKFNGQVICVILTDGHENSSTEWHIHHPGNASDEKDLGQLIKRKQEEGWSFVFLGAGGSEWLEKTFGHVVASTQFSAYEHTGSGNQVAYAAASRSMLRSRVTGDAMTVNSADFAESAQALGVDNPDMKSDPINAPSTSPFNTTTGSIPSYSRSDDLAQALGGGTSGGTDDDEPDDDSKESALRSLSGD